MSFEVSGASSFSIAAQAFATLAFSGGPPFLSQSASGLGANFSELAKQLLSLDSQDLASTISSFSPVEQGKMLRAVDDLKNPRPAQSGHSARRKVGHAPKVPAQPPAVPDTLGISATFGAGVGALAAKSPSLTRDLQALQNAGWTIVAASGGGSFCNKGTKTITIDTTANNSAALVTQTIAHEAGHARYTANVDTSSRTAYVRTQLADEGAATLSNIRAQREIIANGGADIGIAGNSANHAAYNAAYDAFVAGGSEVDARDAIGTIFGNGERTSNTNQTYTDYYGSFYDANYGTTPTP